MLILTRRSGQKVVISDTITVTVLQVRRHTVQLGIDAPKGVPVHREEIQQRVLAERKAQGEP